MSDPQDQVTVQSRCEPRFEIDGHVRIELDAASIEGFGVNVSSLGVYMKTIDRLGVRVWIEGRSQPAVGHLVRIESQGDGHFGIAVRFDEAHPDLVQ